MNRDKQRVRDINKLRPEKLYIALKELDFSFEQFELDITIDMWNRGRYIGTIVNELQRDCDEIAILIMSLRRDNKIEDREGGLWGLC